MKSKSVGIIRETMRQYRCDIDSSGLEYLSENLSDFETFDREELIDLSEALVGYVFSKHTKWWLLRWTYFNKNAVLCVICRETLEQLSREHGKLDDIFSK